MFKLLKALPIALLFIFSPLSQAQTGYISDNVFIYIHSGPSENFRIIGSVPAGTEIEIIEQSKDQKFTKIIDNKKRTGWVQSQFTSTQQSLKIKYEQLKQQLASEQSKNQALNSNSASFTQQRNQLNSRIDQLSQELQEANQAKEQALAQLVGEDEDIKIKWLVNGGLLAGISMLIGIIITYLPSKKKKKGNWA
ncbi:TIGR04211 family SH3 domain-containing protein [Psychrobium sp. 1_MG-2023]|uniref:TIGR04211 family SH3 domain-containing protein n=1 Tax=Psychrobium sp. 1_MG-2023 TaxID=3062624 RepID=UPI000C337A0A|nr:TIGR04211 family SH3 domain-containing protein [Psychrobium sp. 1_MG-2023]MDP2562267.1 TIGR04211 family SH3 domain-containing protein [Psychrobium sp. 1_MG-2023]PKF57517.1 TIGR04211 family SH3 domain-containing protein [Alteromonadales bacterium alter-6D02]